ncbi:MAG TPA: xanthine dehydrogenase family protein subunit M [Jatrophihabitans sp.]
MKPAAFDYSRPETLPEVVDLLGNLGSDGKVLAGGQSLLPLLSMRLAAPAHLVDINRVAELDYVRSNSDGVRIGALARHSSVERDPGARVVQPMLSKALRLVAHPTIRNRGTTVGSIVHADPAAEMPTVLCLLGGTVFVESSAGHRQIEAAEFFQGPLESALVAGEIAVAAFFPALPAQSGVAFVEVSRRHGDYAVVGVGALITVDDDLRISSARVGLLSVSATPLVLDLTDAIRGKSLDSDLSDAGVIAREAAEPEPDIHASADYRRHLVGVLTDRAVREAAAAASDAALAAEPHAGSSQP